ncbi:MAG: hypothetical protein NW214_09655 [Pseudanabaenaceae cyanobacterium bins.39]|nr:hypothetical protein [Pseudanabaenaceae cyanobacterium bins.39]
MFNSPDVEGYKTLTPSIFPQKGEGDKKNPKTFLTFPFWEENLGMAIDRLSA